MSAGAEKNGHPTGKFRNKRQLAFLVNNILGVTLGSLYAMRALVVPGQAVLLSEHLPTQATHVGLVASVDASVYFQRVHRGECLFTHTRFYTSMQHFMPLQLRLVSKAHWAVRTFKFFVPMHIQLVAQYGILGTK